MYQHPLDSYIQARGDSLALICDDFILTGESFGILIRHLSKYFKALGIKHNDKVGLCLPYNGDWILTFWALNLLGAIVIPIKASSTEEEIKGLIELFELKLGLGLKLKLAGVSTLLDDFQELLDQTRLSPPVEINTIPQQINAYLHPSYQKQIQQRYQIKISPSKKAMKECAWGWERKLILLTTSGTTGGKPKIVSLKARQLIFNAFGSAIRIGHLSSDCWLACLPFHHIGGLSILIRAMLYQVPVVFSEFKPQHIEAWLNSGLITNTSLTPTMLSQLLAIRASQKPYPSQLRAILIGGAPTSQRLWEQANAIPQLPIKLTWGMSEAASQVCTQLQQLPPHLPIPTIPFVQVELEKQSGLGFESIDMIDINENHEHKNEPQGRLVIKGPTTRLGELKTDDIGKVTRKGIIVLGRADDVILSGGVNIHPEEIEQALLSSHLVEEAVIAKLEDETWGERPVAIIKLSAPNPFQYDHLGRAILEEMQSQENEKAYQHELTRLCRLRLSAYKVPSYFTFVSFIPKDALGKISRKKILAQLQLQERLLQNLKAAQADTLVTSAIQENTTKLAPSLSRPSLSPLQPLFFNQILEEATIESPTIHSKELSDSLASETHKSMISIIPETAKTDLNANILDLSQQGQVLIADTEELQSLSNEDTLQPPYTTTSKTLLPESSSTQDTLQPLYTTASKTLLPESSSTQDTLQSQHASTAETQQLMSEKMIHQSMDHLAVNSKTLMKK